MKHYKVRGYYLGRNVHGCHLFNFIIGNKRSKRNLIVKNNLLTFINGQIYELELSNLIVGEYSATVKSDIESFRIILEMDYKTP